MFYVITQSKQQKVTLDFLDENDIVNYTLKLCIYGISVNMCFKQIDDFLNIFFCFKAIAMVV